MTPLDYYEIGRRIRKCRENLGISQEAAAEKCGISPSFYSNIERGVKVMSLEMFTAICRCYSVSADFLLNDQVAESGTVIVNILTEAKKAGALQYDKYLRVLKALALIADELYKKIYLICLIFQGLWMPFRA